MKQPPRTTLKSVAPQHLNLKFPPQIDVKNIMPEWVSRDSPVGTRQVLRSYIYNLSSQSYEWTRKS